MKGSWREWVCVNLYLNSSKTEYYVVRPQHNRLIEKWKAFLRKISPFPFMDIIYCPTLHCHLEIVITLSSVLWNKIKDNKFIWAKDCNMKTANLSFKLFLVCMTITPSALIHAYPFSLTSVPANEIWFKPGQVYSGSPEGFKSWGESSF